jgi:hypothetical protein
MAQIHIGIASTLAAIPKADISDGDIAYIWLNSFKRTMVFDSTAINVTDTTNHPYYQRPDNYGAGPGVWIEDVGLNQPEVWSASQIITGQLTSTNWGASVGSEYDLDLAKFRLGGSNVDAAGTAPGVFLGLDSGAYKFYVGDGSNKYFKFDATDFILNLTNLVISSVNQTIKLGTGNDIISLDAADATYRLAIGHATYGSAPFRVTKAGVLTATGANISGAITGSTIDIGGADVTSFHIDINGNMWLGAAAYNINTNPFAVSNAGLLRAISGIIGGFTLGSTTLTATNLLLDAGNQEIKLGTGNDIISLDAADGTYRLAIGHATYGSAPFRVTKAGNVYLSGDLDLEDGGNINIKKGGDIILEGGSSGNPSLIRITSSLWGDGISQLQFAVDASNYFHMYIEQSIGAAPYSYLLQLGPNASLISSANLLTIYIGQSQSNVCDIVRLFALDEIAFVVNDLTRVRINSDGEFNFTDCIVGIGTEAPSINADLTLEGGTLCIKETTTPTADTNYGKVYTKNDNFLYFQSGDGNEHKLAFV